jgi:hypothetical protein
MDPVYLHELKMLLLYLLCKKYRGDSCLCVLIFTFGTTKPTYTTLRTFSGKINVPLKQIFFFQNQFQAVYRINLSWQEKHRTLIPVPRGPTLTVHVFT